MEGRVKAVRKHLSEITNILDEVNDSGALDYTISLLFQASNVL